MIAVGGVAGGHDDPYVNYNNTVEVTATTSINDGMHDNIVRLKCDNDYGVSCTFFNIQAAVDDDDDHRVGFDYGGGEGGGQTAGRDTNGGNGNGLMYPPEMKTYIEFIESRLERIPVGLFEHYTNVLELHARNIGLHKLDNASFVGGWYLEILDLSANNIDKLTGDVLGNVSNVKWIDMSSNRLRCIDEPAFGGLHKLTYLDLSHNQLGTMAKGTWAATENLQVLILSDNQLVEILDEHFRATRQLIYLSLSYNQLTTIEANAFHNLPQLEYLHLSHNELTAFHGVGVHARYLYVSHNQLQLLFIPACIQVLDAQFNQLVELECDPINDEMEIEIAILSNNALQTFHCVAQMKHLRILNMAHNNLRHLANGALTKLPALAILQLDHNQITNIEVDALAALHGLEFLDLSHNQLKVLDLNVFPAGEIQLSTLLINGNPMNELEQCHIVLQLDSLIQHDVLAGNCSENDVIIGS